MSTMFQHTDIVTDSGQAKSVVISIQRKLFLSRINVELERSVWGLDTTLDAAFKPFASKQQVMSPSPPVFRVCTATRL